MGSSQRQGLSWRLGWKRGFSWKGMGTGTCASCGARALRRRGTPDGGAEAWGEGVSGRETLACLETAEAMGFIGAIDPELGALFHRVIGPSFVRLIEPRR